jgi:hypothetical protein
MNDTTKNRETQTGIVPLKWEGSIVLFIASLLNNMLAYLSPMTLFRWYCKRKNRMTPLWTVELWVFFLLLAQGCALIWGATGYWLIWVVAIYGLLDLLGVASRDIVAALLLHSCILVRDPLRWLLIALLNVAQVVICFAILFLYYGTQFEGSIASPVTALYQSALTFTTLGYGDIQPVSSIGRIIVCLELGFFLLFLLAKIPIAMSVVRIQKLNNT